MDIYTVTIPPAQQPILLSNAKAWLRITNTAEDTIIENIIIPSAVQIVENFLNRWLVERTAEGKFDAFQVSPNYDVKPFLELRRAPLLSVSSVIGSIGGSSVSLSHQEKIQSSFSRILLEDEELNGFDDTPFPITVTFVAGYGDPGDVPASIITALYELVGFLWSNRGECEPGCASGSSGQGMPGYIANMIANYRIVATY